MASQSHVQNLDKLLLFQQKRIEEVPPRRRRANSRAAVTCCLQHRAAGAQGRVSHGARLPHHHARARDQRHQGHHLCDGGGGVPWAAARDVRRCSTRTRRRRQMPSSTANATRSAPRTWKACIPRHSRSVTARSALNAQGHAGGAGRRAVGPVPGGPVSRLRSVASRALQALKSYEHNTAEKKVHKARVADAAVMPGRRSLSGCGRRTSRAPP